MKKLFITSILLLGLLSSCGFAMDKGHHGPNRGPFQSVTLINAFAVPEGKEAESIKFWEEAADFMRQQPGYISTALHQAILPNAKFALINVAKWKSVESFKAASQALRTKSGIKLIEGLVPNPSLYKVIRSD